MDTLWLQNSVSRQFLMNAVATISEQLITINNVVNGLVSDSDTTIADNSPTNTLTNRSNENLYTKKLNNSIRRNVACSHRHDFSGSPDNYLYQQKSVECEPQFEPQPTHHRQQQVLHRLQSPNCSANAIKNIKAIGNIVNLDIEKSGTISTYDCDSNYSTTNATTTITCHSNYVSVNNSWDEHNVKNDKCNNNNDNKKSEHKHSTRTPSAPASLRTGSNRNEYHLYRINIDSEIPANITPTSAKNVFYAQFDKHAQINRSKWWKNLVIVICYLFLLSSSLRICSANKHEGNFHCFTLLIFPFQFLRFDPVLCYLCTFGGKYV